MKIMSALLTVATVNCGPPRGGYTSQAHRMKPAIARNHLHVRLFPTNGISESHIRYYSFLGGLLARAKAGSENGSAWRKSGEKAEKAGQPEPGKSGSEKAGQPELAPFRVAEKVVVGSVPFSRFRQMLRGHLASLPNGNLYVADSSNNDVLEHNGGTGAFIQVFASSGLTYPQFSVFH
jgi:hypothetical protein